MKKLKHKTTKTKKSSKRPMVITPFFFKKRSLNDFSKYTIAKDIEKYLHKEKLICPSCSVVIPEGGYYYEAQEDKMILWDGNFEVFARDMNTITDYGKFGALAPLGATNDDNYSLDIIFKGKIRYIYG